MMALAATPQLDANPLLSMIRKPHQLLCPNGLVFTKGEKFMRRHMLKLVGSASQDSAEVFALLDGPPGTGKTVLQRIADPPRKYRSACGAPVTLVFTGNDFSGTSPSLFRDMRSSY
jgi:hypothetical protein